MSRVRRVLERRHLTLGLIPRRSSEYKASKSASGTHTIFNPTKSTTSKKQAGLTW